MDKRRIVVITEWWDYKVFFSSLNSSVFSKFSTMNRLFFFFNKEKPTIRRSHCQSPLSLQKGLGYWRVKAGHEKIFREIKWQELQGVSRGSVLRDSLPPDPGGSRHLPQASFSLAAIRSPH